MSLSSNHGDFATMFGGFKFSVLIANALRALSSESASIQHPSWRMEFAQHGSLVSSFRGTRWKNAILNSRATACLHVIEVLRI